jgi:hypothetical protein
VTGAVLITVVARLDRRDAGNQAPQRVFGTSCGGCRSLEATELITKLLSTPKRGPRETELKREVDPVITRDDAEPK